MAQYHYSRQALEDLNSIGDYIATDNPDAADRLLDRIDERCKLLALNPHTGSSAAYLVEKLRAIAVGSYVIFYFPLLDDGGIRVVRILHGARDLPAVIEEGLSDTLRFAPFVVCS